MWLCSGGLVEELTLDQAVLGSIAAPSKLFSGEPAIIIFLGISTLMKYMGG